MMREIHYKKTKATQNSFPQPKVPNNPILLSFIIYVLAWYKR
jgi:hypothetical protein